MGCGWLVRSRVVVDSQYDTLECKIEIMKITVTLSCGNQLSVSADYAQEMASNQTLLLLSSLILFLFSPILLQQLRQHQPKIKFMQG